MKTFEFEIADIRYVAIVAPPMPFLCAYCPTKHSGRHWHASIWRDTTWKLSGGLTFPVRLDSPRISEGCCFACVDVPDCKKESEWWRWDDVGGSRYFPSGKRIDAVLDHLRGLILNTSWED